MEIENVPTAPTSIIFISIFWILLGTVILAVTSTNLSAPYYSSLPIFGLIPFMIGIGFIMVGWGLLTFRKSAYYIALILSCIGAAILVLFNSASLGNQFFYSWYDIRIETILMSMFPLLFLLMFFCMIAFLLKNRKYYENTMKIDDKS